MKKNPGVRRERDLDARSIRLAFSDVSRAVTPDTPTLAAVAHGTPKARWSQAQQVAHVQSSGAASRTARRGHQLDIVRSPPWQQRPRADKQQSHLVAPPDKCNRGGRGNVKTSKKGTRIQRRKLAGSLIGWTLETRSTSAGRRYSIWHAPSGMKSCRSKAEAERVVAEESLIGIHR